MALQHVVPLLQSPERREHWRATAHVATLPFSPTGATRPSLPFPTPLPRISLRARTDRVRPSRATIAAVAVVVGTILLALIPPAPLGAQAGIGFGDDATTLPAGMVRLGFLNEWMRFDQRFTAADGARIETDARVRTTPITLEIGLLDRLTIGAKVPSVGTFGAVTYFPAGAPAGHADSLRMFGQSAVGDVEVWTKLQILVVAQHGSERDEQCVA